MKSPAVQHRDEEARLMVDAFIRENAVSEDERPAAEIDEPAVAIVAD
jgi:hypothetical protein